MKFHGIDTTITHKEAVCCDAKVDQELEEQIIDAMVLLEECGNFLDRLEDKSDDKKKKLKLSRTDLYEIHYLTDKIEEMLSPTEEDEDDE